MAALGIAIMIVAGVATLDIVLENTRNTDASIVGQTVSNVDLGGFFTAGVLVGIAFMFGLMLLLAGLRRANRKRLERKELERSFAGTATQAETLQEERDRLAAELEEERRARHRSEQTVPAHAGSAAPTNAASTSAAPMGAASDGGTHEVADHQRQHVAAANDAPIYPSEPATGPASTGPASAGPASTGPVGSSAAGPAAQERTDERTKPSLKQRLLGS